MVIYVTRHGQPAIGDLPPDGDHEFPPGDPALTSRGLEQARRLGEYLKARSFNGRIYSSPYRRTLLTAQEVAAATGAETYPEKALQEYVPREGVPDVKTLTLPEIKRLFANIASESSLEDAWLFAGPEDAETVRRRVRPFLERLFESNEEEALLVGHGASVSACKKILFEAGGIPYEERHNWNCSLSKFVVKNGRTVDVELNCDISFMPRELVTSNMLKYADAEGEERG